MRYDIEYHPTTSGSHSPVLHVFPPTALLPLLVYPYFHVRNWRKMCKIRNGKRLNSIQGETSRSMLLMGIILSYIVACP